MNGHVFRHELLKRYDVLQVKQVEKAEQVRQLVEHIRQFRLAS